MTALLCLADVAHRLAISERAVKRLIATWKLDAVKVAGKWRIEPKAVDAYLAAQRKARQPKVQTIHTVRPVPQVLAELPLPGADRFLQ